jgi:hypothetical protein
VEHAALAVVVRRVQTVEENGVNVRGATDFRKPIPVPETMAE